MQYYVQHGAGLGDLVASALDGDVADIKIQFSDDSGIIFETHSKATLITDLSYVKNAFQILGTVARSSVTGSIDQMVKHIRKRSLLQCQRRGGAFRTMANVDGQLVGLPRDTRSRLESVIAEQTGGRLNARGGSGVEYWVVGRRDLDIMLFCLRLTSGAKKAGSRGSLHTDLSHLLVKASLPLADDVFLDPFAGSGSIVAARIDQPYRTATYSDMSLAELRGELPSRLLRSHRIHILDEDARELPSILDNSITSIVTDPPWGEHEDLKIPYVRFAESMMQSFDRVLDKHSGRLVLLLSRRSADNVTPLWRPSNLQLDSSYEILVNGHPATVLVGGRSRS